MEKLETLFFEISLIITFLGVNYLLGGLHTYI
ncbi:MAG: hypothetical protein BWY64_02366 [bacterium ADurb.Bin363]|mgnify:CR=1 FL=1|nr:MAG: hypothetical protein BWY64_02366 [bacterium ADurb.Bin363]